MLSIWSDTFDSLCLTTIVLLPFAKLPVFCLVGRDKRASDCVVRPMKERERRELMRQMAEDLGEAMH
jgi:hypothetical protein